MPGGSLHSPIWTPYALYGSVDYIYGWKAYNEHNGFTAAQTFLNVVETVMYGYYLWIVYVYGKASSTKGRGAPKPSLVGWIGEARSVGAQMGALAALIGFSAALMTLAKTILYGDFSLVYLIPDSCLASNIFYPVKDSMSIFRGLPTSAITTSSDSPFYGSFLSEFTVVSF